MEQECIKYEEALALKELGFNEPCWGVYGYNRYPISVPDSLIDKTKLTFLPEISTNEDFHLNPRDLKNSNIGDNISAPTYSQAFKWFRDKYGLYQYISTYDATDFEWYIHNKNIPKDEDLEDTTTQDTYEEAELACLKKLIELVKNK